jgi:hypothetical protein
MIPTKKGQSDVFKLLIAAVVAMAILAIVAGILTQVPVSPCLGNAINDIATTISTAKSGLDASTPKICLKESESFDSRAITDKVNGIDSLTFGCYQDSSMCNGENPPLKYTQDRITAMRETTFTALVQCDKSGDGYTCTLEIKSAN